MPTENYGKYVLASLPQFHSYRNGWVPYASAQWLDGKEWRYHQLQDMDMIFDTEQEAVDFGFAMARAWINQER